MKRGYSSLLGLVVVSFVVLQAAPDTDVTRLLVVWLQAATVVAAVRIARAGHRLVLLAAQLATLVAVVATFSLAFEGSVREGAMALATALLVGVAPVVIAGGLVRDLRKTLTVTVQSVSGVLSIYLLLGMFFSFTFAVVDQLSDKNFFAELSDPSRSDYLYFSYTTLTTTGYGDLTAAIPVGRTLAVTEALMGEIYLVTIVALIVSNIRPRRRRPED